MCPKQTKYMCPKVSHPYPNIRLQTLNSFFVHSLTKSCGFFSQADYLMIGLSIPVINNVYKHPCDQNAQIGNNIVPLENIHRY